MCVVITAYTQVTTRIRESVSIYKDLVSYCMELSSIWVLVRHYVRKVHLRMVMIIRISMVPQ